MGACGPGEADFVSSLPGIHFIVENCLGRGSWIWPLLAVGLDNAEAGRDLIDNFARLITNKDPAAGLTLGMHILGPCISL